ncbi:hypothetical protein FQA39_LY09921 [Lamprigera yunnana]|nr:hypothetical protein FQA39_LY09921 [Lamprigera yunnana]
MMKNAEQILSNNEEFDNVNQNNEDGDSHVEQLSTRSNVDQEENCFLKNTEWPGEYANATQQNQQLASVEEVEKFIHEEDADDFIKDKDYEPNFSDVSLEEISEPEVVPQNFVNKSNNEGPANNDVMTDDDGYVNKTNSSVTRDRPRFTNIHEFPCSAIQRVQGKLLFKTVITTIA